MNPNEVYLTQYVRSYQEAAAQLLNELVMARTNTALNSKREAELLTERELAVREAQEVRSLLQETADKLASTEQELATLRHSLKVTTNQLKTEQKKCGDLETAMAQNQAAS